MCYYNTCRRIAKNVICFIFWILIRVVQSDSMETLDQIEQEIAITENELNFIEKGLVKDDSTDIRHNSLEQKLVKLLKKRDDLRQK